MMRLELLEQQNQKGLSMARKETDFLDVRESGSGGVERTKGQSREKGKVPKVIDEREYPIWRPM